MINCRLLQLWLWLKLLMNLNTGICTGVVLLPSIVILINAVFIGYWFGACIYCRGNVLLSRNDFEALQFILEGKNMTVQTFGLQISIIDFTLSRINTSKRFFLPFDLWCFALSHFPWLKIVHELVLVPAKKGVRELNECLTCRWRHTLFRSLIRSLFI